MTPLPRRTALPLVLAVVLAACGTPVREVPPPVPQPSADDIVTTIFFVGDAGAPQAGGDPVLQALRADLSTRPGALVLFLGDNLYPKGMPEADAPDRAESERRLGDQIDAVLGGGGRGIFIPGNHDWQQGGSDGWWRVYRQALYVDARGPGVETVPRLGCPGPVERDVGDRIRLIILDTQWYLQGGPKPGIWSPCRVQRPEELGDSLRAAVDRAGDREVIVAAHHPMRTNGKHGGYFTVKQHIFPLTEVASWAYLPLPIIGSLYPIARQSGISNQDLSGGRYQAMVAAFDSAFQGRPPLIYAAGHEHNLQVLQGEAVRHFLVSGAGYYGHTSATTWRDDTRFAAAASGYMRLDVLRSNAMRLSVVTVDQAGTATEAYSAYLE